MLAVFPPVTSECVCVCVCEGEREGEREGARVGGRGDGPERIHLMKRGEKLARTRPASRARTRTKVKFIVDRNTSSERGRNSGRKDDREGGAAARKKKERLYF